MSDLFQLAGSYGTAPASGSTSGLPAIIAPISESLSITKKHTDDVELTVDTPVSLAFGGITNANVVIVKAVGGKVRLRLTSADGATQAAPVDSFFVLVSRTVPVTAIDVTRVVGTTTSVTFFLAQIS